MSLDLLVAEKREHYHGLNFCTHIVSGVMLTLYMLLWVLRLVVSSGWLWWSEVSEKAVSISSPFLGWMQCSPWLSICFFLGSALDPFYMYSNMLLHFFSGPCTTYYGRCPLCTLDTHFVLSVTTKPSFASSRSASFSWPSVSCVQLWGSPVPACAPSSTIPYLCSSVLHPASPLLKAPAIVPNWYFYTLYCVWVKNVSFCLEWGEPRGWQLWHAEYEAPQVFLSSVQVLSSVSTSVPLSGCLLLQNFTSKPEGPEVSTSIVSQLSPEEAQPRKPTRSRRHED